MSKFTGKMCKVKSMTLDTNVISDIPAMTYFERMLETRPIPQDQQEYFQRCRSSKKAIFVMLDFDIEKIGLRIVYKELLACPPLHMHYKTLFHTDAKSSKETAHLAERYMRQANLPAADAAVVALTSSNRIDVLLSWNRDDVSNVSTISKIEQINKAAHIPTPEILTPREFLDRVIKSDKKSIALSPSPLLPVYRVDSYLSKHGL